MFDKVLHFLVSPWYKYIFLSFAATILSLIIRSFSRPSGKPELEDWAVGHDLAQVAMFTLLADGVAEGIEAINRHQPLPDKVILLGPALFFMFFFLLCSVLLVRVYGWEPVTPHLPCPHLKKGAIFGPIPFGLLCFAVLMIYMGGQ